MTDDPREFAVARVVAALDATSHDAETLATVVELAARFGAEAAGLFIEDINFLRLCALPVTRHVGAFPFDAGPDLEQAERQLKDLAARAEAALKAAATARHLPWSFQVLRGSPTKELGAATAARDLLVVGHAREIAGMPRHLGSGLHEAIRRAERSTLHVPRAPLLNQPIAAILAGSALVQRTLSAAVRLTDPTTREVEILVVGEGAAKDAAKTEIAAWLADQGLRAHFLPPSRLQSDDLRRVLARSRTDQLVVVSADALIAAGIEAEDMLVQERRSVMIIR